MVQKDVAGRGLAQRCCQSREGKRTLGRPGQADVLRSVCCKIGSVDPETEKGVSVRLPVWRRHEDLRNIYIPQQ